MIDHDEIFLNILKMFLLELNFILLYCIYRITPGHITPHPLRFLNYQTFIGIIKKGYLKLGGIY